MERIGESDPTQSISQRTSPKIQKMKEWVVNARKTALGPATTGWRRVIHQNCHLEPLQDVRFISKLPLVSASQFIFTSSKSSSTSLTLPGSR
ncbi:hypothetical protein PO909_001296 [Leuciscus waleckii]